MAVDYVHRLVVSGRADRIHDFRKRIYREYQRTVAGETWTEIVMEFDDVRAAYEELSGRGVPFEIELRPVTSDGERDLLAAHFRDPDGHVASVTGWVTR